MKHHHHLLVILWGVFLSCSPNCQLHGQSADHDPSLVLHFDFDEDYSNAMVLDMSGNGNHGWQFNPTNWITASNGVFGTAAAQFTINSLMCDGTTNGQVYTNYPIGWPTNPPAGVHFYPASQYIGVTNLNGFEYLTNGTISYWAKFDGGNSNGQINLLDCSRDVRYAFAPSEASNSWQIAHYGFFYRTEFSVSPATGGYRSVVWWPTVGGAVTTIFHLFTLTVDCSNDRAIAYYDGLPCQTNTIGLPWIRIYGGKTKHWLCVGAMSFDGTPEWGDDRYPNSGFMSGRMDDIRIYNRTLSAAEVLALTNRFIGNATIQMTNSQSVQVSWTTTSNAVYRVESVSNVTATTWTTRTSGIQGTNGTQVFTDSVLGLPSQFYRVRVLP